MYEAMCDAVEDSSIDIADIGTIYVSNFLGGPLSGQLHLNSVVASLLPGMNIPILRIETACASAGVAFKQATYALSEYDNIMVVGAEKMTSPGAINPSEAIAMASDRFIDRPDCPIFPANYALIAQQYMHRYNIDHEVLERVSYINHKNANLNPLAHFYHKEVSMDAIKRSPIIASPLNLFDCSPVSDGAVAVIISKEKRSDRDVRIISSQFTTDSISITQREDMTSFKAVKLAASKAYRESGLKPGDINILEVHDCFTISELIALEDLGFCAPGEASKLISDGSILKDGVLPVNTDGGLKANGHPIGATGLAQIYEIVAQLRGEAGHRQVNDARFGMAHNIGGVGGTASVTILGVA
jgi:acetyl-CoA C-acetyltransferase